MVVLYGVWVWWGCALGRGRTKERASVLGCERARGQEGNGRREMEPVSRRVKERAGAGDEAHVFRKRREASEMVGVWAGQVR